MSRAAIALLCMVLGLVGSGLGWWLGVSHGEAKATANRNAQLVSDLGEIIDTNKRLTAAANTASQTLRRTMGARQAFNQSTTKELADALAPTADRRADCVLPADGVRILSEAQARAAAAAAGGFAAGLPAAGGSASGR